MRVRSAIGLLSFFLLLVAFHVFRDHLASWDLNAIRLQRTFALAAGVPLYPPSGEGVAMLPLYGPVGAVAYLPAVLARSPTTALAIGQLLSLFYFFVPPFAWHLLAGRGTEKRTASHWDLALLAFLCFAAGSVDLWPLEYAAFTVHVDAPALSLALLACLAVHRASAANWRFAYGVSALCAVLAVWTKQVVLPLLLALPLYLLLTEGARSARRYLVVLAAAGLLVGGLVVWWFGPPWLIWFHLVTVPSRHPWRFGGGGHALLTGTGLLVSELTTLWGICLASLVLRIDGMRRTVAGADWRQALRREPWPLLWLVGLSMVPTAVLSRVKTGGDRNALSYVAYFLLAGATLSLLAAATAAKDRPALMGDRRRARAGLLVLPAVLLAVVVTVQEPGCLVPWRHALNRDALPQDIAFRYAAQHPGEAYFPRLTLSSYLAEGRFYHQSPGFIDAFNAGVPIDDESLWAHLPSRLRIVAFDRNGYESQVEYLPFQEQLEPAPDDPELPGFVIYAWRDGG